MSIDFRPLADKLNAHLMSESGKKMLASIPDDGERELYTFREGGFRRVITLRKEGLSEDFYPAVKPTCKGENISRIFDAHRVVEGAWNSGQYTSYAEFEKDILKRFGATNEPGST